MHAVVRRATATDVPRIAAIYNHWIEQTHTSFDLEPHTLDERLAWFRKYSHGGRYQAFVADADDLVVGTSYSSPFRDKTAYETTVETTVVVDPDAVGHGLGRRLLEVLLESLAATDVHRAIALIALPNQPSVDLHADLGYRSVGVLTEVGRKFGTYWSVAVMERAF